MKRNVYICTAELPRCIAVINIILYNSAILQWGFPDSSVSKESTCNAGVMGGMGLIPGLGRPPGAGKGYPLRYSALENSMDCIAHGVTESRTGLSGLHFHFHTSIKNKVNRN